MYRKKRVRVRVMFKLHAVASRPKEEGEMQVWFVCAMLDAP